MQEGPQLAQSKLGDKSQWGSSRFVSSETAVTLEKKRVCVWHSRVSLNVNLNNWLYEQILRLLKSSNPTSGPEVSERNLVKGRQSISIGYPDSQLRGFK